MRHQYLIVGLLSVICGLLGYIAAQLTVERPQQAQQPPMQQQAAQMQTPTVKQSNPSTGQSDIADGGYRTMPVVDYPESSLENGEEGIVQIKVIVEPNGKISDSKVSSSSGHARLDRAALRAAKSASYQPKSVNGQAVRTRFTAVYKFKS